MYQGCDCGVPITIIAYVKLPGLLMYVPGLLKSKFGTKIAISPKVSFQITEEKNTTYLRIATTYAQKRLQACLFERLED